MISIEDAVKKIEDITEEKVKQVSDYNGKYYLLLVEGGSPFYIVDKNTGDNRFLNPLEDIKALAVSIETKVLKRY